MANVERPDEKKPGVLEDLFQTRYPEVSVGAIVFGVIFGVILTAAITYAGLKIGFTILGSSIAAVVGFGVLRGGLRRGTILEINIGQTVASAINSASPGIIFTVPVLWLIGQDMTADRFWTITLAAVIGGVLGVAFIIPLRKQMIDIERLRFPSGVAVGAILKSPGAGPKKSLVLVGGIVVAALIYLPVELPNLKVGGQPLPGYNSLGWRLSDPRTGSEETLDRVSDRDGDGEPDLILTQSTFDAGRAIGLPDYLLLVFAITPLSFGTGYLTGRAGLLVLAGGILAFFVLNPAAYSLGWIPPTVAPDEVPNFGRTFFNRPLGIGMLLGGALMGVVASFPAIRAAFASMARPKPGKQGADELGMRFLMVTAVLFIGLLFLAVQFVTGGDNSGGLLSGWPSLLRSLIIALVGAGWIWFAGIIIAQCTGMTDWSPVSGMALLTVVLVMLLAGTDQIAGAVMIGAALCVAIAAAADMMTDLKTGYIVGAKPRRQQTLELIAAVLGPVISMGTLLLIVARNQLVYDIPIGEGTETTAPQAEALKAVILSVQTGDTPVMLYGAGALLGAILGLGSFPGLGVLIGLSMYLPLEYVLTYGLGCVANMIVRRVKGKHWAEEWGVPFCAGLIVGEAILALMVNMIVIVIG
jgi:uncharacterized oligopeptide transporter (OPT) family protein